MVESTENLRPKVTGVSIRGERSSHAVAPPGARGTVPDFHLHAHLSSKDLSTLQISQVDRLLHLVLVAVGLVGGALVMALAGTWPGTRREATTVAMFCVVAFVVARKVFGSVDVFANILTFRPSHDLLIPCYESIVPVALRVEVDVVTASILMCCCWCCRSC